MAGNVIDFQRTCIIIVVFAIFLVTIHHSTNGMFSSHGPQYDFASFAKFSTPAPIANKPPTKEHVPVCRNSSDDPYLLPGYLLTNENDTASPSWEPFDVAFPPPPQFLKNLMDHKSFPWLHGKTLLLIGDSVDRNNAAYLCDFLNGTTRVTSLTNLNEDFPASERTAGSHPTVCRLEAHDFEIITFFHYGMHDQGEEIWTYKSSYTPPGLFQTRIPLLETLFATYHRQPNLITLTSGLWDLLAWTLEDAHALAPAEVSIRPERLRQWLVRAEQFVDIVHSIFPHSLMMWRFLHYCRVDRGTWFLDAPEGLDQTPRAPFHEMRVYQMNQAYERLLDYKPQLRKFSWGQLLTGHLEYGMADNLHPNNFGAILWSDMVFYYLSTL